jgi:hypothetical protein
MGLHVDRPRDFEHSVYRVQLELHAGRMWKRKDLERLEHDLLIDEQALPPPGQETADINLV